MLLGVVLHAAASFIPGEPDASWPYRDPQRNLLFGIAAVLIHMFRMPAFYVLAGFFVAQSIDAKGASRVLRDRTTRILLPLTIGWVLLFPLVKGAFVFGVAQMANAKPEDALSLAIRTATQWTEPHPMHLWFLWYLWLFVASYIAMKYLAARLMPTSVSHRWNQLVNGVIRLERPFVPSPLLVVATFLVILHMKMPGIDTPGSFIPDMGIFACYFVFFWLGTRLHVLREILPELQNTAGRRLWRAAFFMLIYIIACIVWFDGLTKTGSAPYGAFIVAQAALSLAIWPLILGGAGLAERWISREIAPIRYLSDSAYWVYLMHLPLCIGIAVLLRQAPYSALTKCGITIGATIAVCLLTYEAARRVIPAGAKH